MSRVTRDSFVNSGTTLDLDDLDADDRAVLAEAGLDAATLTRVAGTDGVIAGKPELKQLFAAIDRLDRDGSYASIATTTKDASGKETATASGAALASLQQEIAEARLGHTLRERPPTPIEPSPNPATAITTLPSATAKSLPGNAKFDTDPPWLKTALKEYGVTETKGAGAQPRIIEYFEHTYQKGEHTDDSGKANAWCAAFVTFCLAENNIKNRKAVGAREFETWGEASEPFRGAIVVLQRGNQKHVAILAGVDKNGDNLYLGGNQGDRVQTVKLTGYEVVAIRKPPGFEVTDELKALPTINAKATAATR